jgi:hypothetical protein
MNAGVSTGPCGVVRRPALAVPSVFRRLKEKVIDPQMTQKTQI